MRLDCKNCEPMHMNLKAGDAVEVFTFSFGVVERGIIIKIEGEKITIKTNRNKTPWYYAKNVYKVNK